MRIRIAEANTKNTNMKLKRIVITSYITLFILAYVYMLLVREHDAFAGIFLGLLSLPWSFAVLPIALTINWLFPGEFMNRHHECPVIRSTIATGYNLMVPNV